MIVRYAVAIMSDRVQHSQNLGDPGFGLPPDVLDDVHALRLWPHETDWNRRVSMHPFKYMGNPAHSALGREYRLKVQFPSIECIFSVVTSYLLNEVSMASINECINAWARELHRADRLYNASDILEHELSILGITAQNFLFALPYALSQLPTYITLVD